MAMIKRKTLLVLSQVYVPDPAAVGQHMHEAAAGMVARGWPVRVVTSARGYDDPRKRYALHENLAGVSIRRIPAGSFGKRTMLVRLLGQAFFLMQAFFLGLLTRNLGAILVSTSPPMCSIVAVLISMFRRVPIVYWVMDINPDQVVSMGLMSERALPVRLMEWLNRIVLNRAHTVVTLDRFMAETLSRKAKLEGRLAIVPPWAPEGSEPIGHAKNPFRLAHALSGKFVFMYSGNHSISHPLTTFLAAAERLRDRKDILFLFVGGGRGKEEVDAAIRSGASNVVSLPYQPRETLRDSLSAADVHLVSMGREMVGIVHPCKVYGAMAVARPLLVLSPQKCHATELIGFERFARHVEHGDVGAMVGTILEFASMPREYRDSMGYRASAVLSSYYSGARQNGQVARIIEAALVGEAPVVTASEDVPAPSARRQAA